MTERELLEFAAKAAGQPGVYQRWESSSGYVSCGIAPAGRPGREWWNPLTSDADAFRLAVKLRIEVEPWVHGDDEFARASVGEVLIDVPHNGDPYAAARRAIVRAASEIGKGMK